MNLNFEGGCRDTNLVQFENKKDVACFRDRAYKEASELRGSVFQATAKDEMKMETFLHICPTLTSK